MYYNFKITQYTHNNFSILIWVLALLYTYDYSAPRECNEPPKSSNYFLNFLSQEKYDLFGARVI